MKKYIAGIILSLIVLSATNVNADVAIPASETYARICIITDIEFYSDGINLVTIKNCNGDVYAYWDDSSDLFVGDIMSCVMYKNGTVNVIDDICIDATPDRPDLLTIE